MTDQANENRRWTVRTALQRGLEVFREEGAKSLWFKILGETCYRRLVLFRRDVGAFPALPSSSPAFIFKELSIADEEAYRCCRATDAAIRPAWMPGKRCLLSLVDRQIVGNCWMADRSAEITYLDLTIEFAQNQLYLFDVFTAPAYRGHGVAARLVRCSIEHGADEGVETVWVAILPENVRGRKLFRSLGFEEAGKVGCFWLGPWRWPFCKPLNNDLAVDHFPRVSRER